MTENVNKMLPKIGMRAREASSLLALASAEQKREALDLAAKEIGKASSAIIAANARDMEFGREKGLNAAMLDRLMLDEGRIHGIIDALKAVAAQPDPVGEVMEEWERPNGLRIRRVRTPLGVIGVIFESRPNVTADAAALCLKSGNAAILRGGSESLHSASAIHEALVKGITGAGLPEHSVQLIKTRDRAAVKAMLGLVEYIDVIVPRGGKGLVGLVQKEARVPVFAHLEGVVHIYVAADADPQKARNVVLNAKTRRTGICGALECLLVDKGFREKHGDMLVKALMEAGVELRGDEAHQGAKGVVAASEEDWGREFLDMILAIREVDGVDEAINFIRAHHSQHTDGIITEDAGLAEKFFSELDSAILMWNASTQFADGGEFGMGAEIGIATGKLHARGPVGARELTSFRYLVAGDGVVRP